MAEQLNEELQRIMAAGRAAIAQPLNDDPMARIEAIQLLWRNWADFEIHMITPVFAINSPPVIHQPQALQGSTKVEHVFPIVDYGYKMATSKGEEMYTAGMSMCKLFFTIEKMIAILIQKLKDEGKESDGPVEIAFDGHEIAQRKGFESVINYAGNLVVTNFDPGAWGERYLEIVKRMADEGYGYPEETPREKWRQHGSSPGMKI